MSKISPLGQSMASLFTPESERLASTQKSQGLGGAAKAVGVKVPSLAPIISGKSGDSLGNPNSPGYEPWGRKATQEKDESQKAKVPGGTAIEAPAEGPEIIRLRSGWEKLLLAQRKLCEKAKGLFTILEGPVKYTRQKKSKMPGLGARGCILDVDLQEVEEEKRHQQMLAKEREKKPA